MIDEDLEDFEDEEIINNNTQGNGIDLSQLEEEINEANNEQVLPELKTIYLYHIYNIVPSHIKFFNSKYSEYIVGWVLHNSSKSNEEELEFYTTETKSYNNKVLPEIIKCSNKTHIHVIIALDTTRGYYHSTDSPDSKWFGFTALDKTSIQLDEYKIITKYQLWNKMFPQQEPYKASLVISEKYYINLLRYLNNRLHQSNKGSLELFNTYTQDKYLYSKKDIRKNNTKIKFNEFVELEDETNKSDISSQAKKQVNKILIKHNKQLEDAELAYETYKIIFLDKGYNSLTEWQQGTQQHITPEITKTFMQGKVVERNIRSKPLDDHNIKDLEKQFPLTTGMIKMIMFHITMKRVEKDVFLILQGPPSCGKTSLSTAIADAYPSSFECTSMEAFLHRDNLGMEGVATKHCESIICDEFSFVDRFGKGYKQVQDQLKHYLSGKEIAVRTRKNTKEILNDTTRIKLIVACVNIDDKRIKDVTRFLEDDAVKDRTIKILFKESFLNIFKTEKKPINQLPLQSFSRYSVSVRFRLDTLVEKISTETINHLIEYLKDIWYLSDYIDIFYNSPRSRIIIDKLICLNSLISNFDNITDSIIEDPNKSVEDHDKDN